MKKLLALLLLPVLAFAAAGDIKIDRKNSTDTAWISTIFAKTNSGFIGLDSSGVPTMMTGLAWTSPTLSVPASFSITGAGTTLDLITSSGQNARFSTTHLLLGGLTVDGTPILQFPTATTNAGGIGFSPDTFLYRSAANTLKTDGSLVLGSNPTLSAAGNLTITANSSGTLIFQTGTNTTALTIDTSQNATWTGTDKAVGFLNTTGTSANSGNGMVQRFRNGYATAGQTPAATTRTYVTGSDVGPFTATQLQVGTIIHWHLDITKTAAGVASATFDIAFGTAGSTSDTARLTFTKPAGVAQIDHCAVEIYATVKTNSASGVVIGDFTLLDDQTNVLGGFLAAAKWVASSTVTSSTFDTTTATHVGLCVTTGASDAWTINHVQVWTANM